MSKVLHPVRRSILAVFASAAFFAGALPASAASLSLGLGISIDGQQVGYVGGAGLGCVDVPDTPTANCTGSNAQVGDLRLDSWSVFVDSDPVISGIVAVTNTSAVTQQYTLTFTLPIAPAIPGSSLIGGSIQGGVTDGNGDGATLSTPTGSAFYTARIDGADVQSLYLDPQSFFAGGFLSTNVPGLAFGTPIPSQLGPAALSTIGIRLDFLLTAGDSASFTSNFVVTPVPVPAAAWLFGGALGALGWLRRRAA